MYRSDWLLRVSLALIAVFLGVIAVRPLLEPETKALAQSARFEHVEIISAAFLYKGQQGLLVLDKRNANAWFIAKRGDTATGVIFDAPVFLIKLPFEKMDQAPQ